MIGTWIISVSFVGVCGRRLEFIAEYAANASKDMTTIVHLSTTALAIGIMDLSCSSCWWVLYTLWRSSVTASTSSFKNTHFAMISQVLVPMSFAIMNGGGLLRYYRYCFWLLVSCNLFPFSGKLSLKLNLFLRKGRPITNTSISNPSSTSHQKRQW